MEKIEATVYSKKKLIRFKYFLSSASNNYLVQYYHGQQLALNRHRISSIKISPNNSKSDSIYICAFDSTDNEIVGGIRIEVKSEENPLPIEKSEVRYVETFSLRTNQYMREGLTVIEICGLWATVGNREHLKSVSLGRELCFQAVQLCLELGFQILTAIVPPHTLVHMTALGFVPDGLIHQIPYPDDRYLSSVIWYFNPKKSKNEIIFEKLNNKEVVEYGS